MKQTLAATAAILTFMLVLVSPTGATGNDSPLGDADTSIDIPDDLERHTSKAMRAKARRYCSRTAALVVPYRLCAV